jgi:hypothetical protein
MTTASEAPKGQRLDELRSPLRLVGGGLLWAALLLFLLAIWLGNKYASMGLLAWGPVLVLALLVLAGALWVFFGRPEGRGASEGTAKEALARQRRLLATALLAGSVALLLLGLWLATQHGLDAFPEVSGMVVLALIGLGTGFTLTRPPEQQLDREAIMAWLLARRHGVMLGLFVAAGVFAALTFWALLAAGIGPEMLGAGLLALLFTGLGIWQALLLPEDANTQTMRALVLSAGAGFGLIVALATAVRTYIWWNTGEIFAEKTPMAESPNVWRLWLCAYVQIAALAILFGSLLLGRTDIRQDPVMRRVLFGYNTVLTGLVLLAALVLLNVVVYVTYPFTLQWSSSLGLHSLNESSKNLLKGLKDPVEVYVLISPKQQVYDDVKTLLQNAQAYTRQLQLRYISPDRDSGQYMALAQKFPVLLRETEQLKGQFGGLGFGGEVGRGVLLVTGTEGAGTRPHAFIPTESLVEEKHMGRRGSVVIFKGEDAIMTQLDVLAQNEAKPSIYFTQSNGELSLVDARQDVGVFVGGQRLAVGRLDGAGLLLGRLKKDGYEVHGLRFGAPPPRDAKRLFPKEEASGDLMKYTRKTAEDTDQIPGDAKLVIIAWPRAPFSKEARAALERYMAKGGKLLVLSNFLPLRDGSAFDPGLGDLLQKYNVRLGNDFLMATRYQNPFRVDAAPPEGSRNKVAESFRTSVFTLGEGVRALGWVRSVEEIRPNAEAVVEPLLVATRELNDDFWAETNVDVLANPFAYLLSLKEKGLLETKSSSKPIPVAVGVSMPEGGRKKPVLAVFGDARFASNRYVEGSAPYYDFLVSTIQWLAERPARIGIRPRETVTYDIQVDQINQSRLLWLPVSLVVLFFIALGLGIWVTRRR